MALGGNELPESNPTEDRNCFLIIMHNSLNGSEKVPFYFVSAGSKAEFLVASF